MIYQQGRLTAKEVKVLMVDDYRTIRIAHRDGLSIRAIARTLHHWRRKMRGVA